MLELYHAGLTTCSKKSRLCLREKGLPYKSHYLSLDKFEHHTPEYRKLNPNGVVPTLVHDGQVVIESGVINEYVDEVFAEVPLRPADALGRAKMRVFCKMADEFALPAVRVPTWSRVKPAMVKAMTDAQFEAAMRDTPLIDHQLKFRALRAEGFTAKEIEESRGRMDYVCDRCETALAEAPYLAGAQYTLADIALLPYVQAFAMTRPELLQTHPRLREWYERVMARPAVKATYQPSDEAPAH